jgi:hypothetical protein
VHYAAPSAIAKYPNQLDVFTVDWVNNQLRTNSYDSGTWSGWRRVSGINNAVTNPTAAVSRTDNIIDVFATNSSSGGTLTQTQWFNGNPGDGWASTWGPPDSKVFAINLGTGPAGVATSSTTEYVFWLDPDSHLRYMYWNGGNWEYTDTGYRGFDLGAPAGLTLKNNSVAVIANPVQELSRDVQVFARGNDNKLYTIYHGISTGWSPWEVVPGTTNIAGAPAAITRYDKCVDVVYRKLNGNAVLIEWTPSQGWTTETIIDGSTSAGYSDPSIASWDQARLDVFNQRQDLRVWHRYWNSPKPAITTVTPSIIALGSSATTITITGENFYPNSAVMGPLGTVLSTTFINETTLTAVLPSSWLDNKRDFEIYVDVPGTTQTNFFSGPIWIGVRPTDGIGVFRPSTHTFYLDYNGNGFWNPGVDKVITAFGISTDIPVSGDWNYDGATEIGVFRNSTHTFYLDYNGNGLWNPGVDRVITAFGISTDIPVSGDWNKGGATDIGVFRPSTHTFYLDYNGNGLWNPGVDKVITAFGISTDIPVSGDWNNDGATDIGVFRPSTHTFYLDYNGNGAWNPGVDKVITAFGISSDIPVSGDWNNDGFTDIGVFRPSTHTFYLDYNGNGLWNPGVDKVITAFGNPTDLPVSGKWSS